MKKFKINIAAMSKTIISYTKETNSDSRYLYTENQDFLQFQNIEISKGYYRLHIKVKSCKPVFESKTELFYNKKYIQTITITQPNFCWTRNLVFIKNKTNKINFYPAVAQEEYIVYCFEVIKLNLIDLFFICYTRFFWNLSLKTLFNKLLFGLKYLLPFYDCSIYNLIQSQMGASLKNVKYSEWIKKFEKKTVKSQTEILKNIKSFKHKPLISIIMPVYNTNPLFLKKTIESIKEQSYTNWEICICDDYSTNNEIRQILEDFKKADTKIKITYNSQNRGIAVSSNNALKLSSGEYCALMDHDDKLNNNALYEIVKIINEKSEILFFYSDEDKIDKNERRYCPYFKPDWDIYLLLSQNYLNHLTVMKSGRLKAIGGWRVGFEGAQDYDLYLRYLNGLKKEQIFHISKVLYHWRAVEGSTSLNAEEKNYSSDAQIMVVNDFLQSNSIKAKAVKNQSCIHHKIIWEIPIPLPLVSIIIPMKDQVDITEKCINSILKKTDYSNYEIVIVNNNSEKNETIEYLNKLERVNKNINVYSYEKEFNYSAINNYAVDLAKGDYLCLMNNDIEIINKGWLIEMMSYAVKPDIGCVGAKLYYPDDTIQHAGIALGIGGSAGHTHKYFTKDSLGYFNYLQIVRSVSAVTAALMLVKKEIYKEVNGFDEINLSIAYNDVDFCLKMMTSGYTNIFTPFAEAYHYESKSRGFDNETENKERFIKEKKYLYEKWKDLINNDSYYSPNLTLLKEDYSYRL